VRPLQPTTTIAIPTPTHTAPLILGFGPCHRHHVLGYEHPQRPCTPRPNLSWGEPARYTNLLLFPTYTTLDEIRHLIVKLLLRPRVRKHQYLRPAVTDEAL